MQQSNSNPISIDIIIDTYMDMFETTLTELLKSMNVNLNENYLKSDDSIDDLMYKNNIHWCLHKRIEFHNTISNLIELALCDSDDVVFACNAIPISSISSLDVDTIFDVNTKTPLKDMIKSIESNLKTFILNEN